MLASVKLDNTLMTNPERCASCVIHPDIVFMMDPEVMRLPGWTTKKMFQVFVCLTILLIIFKLMKLNN